MLQFSGPVHHLFDITTAGMALMVTAFKGTCLAPNYDTKTLSKKILREEHKLYPKAIQMLASKKIRIYKKRIIVS